MKKTYPIDFIPAKLIESLPHGTEKPETWEGWLQRAGMSLEAQLIDIIRESQDFDAEQIAQAIEKHGQALKVFAFGMHTSLKKREGCKAA